MWMREDPGARRSKLSRAKIAEAAVSIADREGFDGVSMRQVAEALGVATMSLYYYVKTRSELMALMDDALMGEMILPSVKKKGAKGLLEIALHSHAMLMRHPWALLTMRGAEPGPNSLRHFEQCLEVLDESRLGEAEKLTLLAMVDDFVFGHALRETESRTDFSPQLAKSMLADGKFPHVSKTFARGRIGGDEKRLQRGLKAIIGSVLSE